MIFAPRHGFTLIEILVVVSIISIMAGTVTFFASQSSATGRDADRQADLRALQAAVEAYKRDTGSYPVGCNATGTWSGEQGTAFACVGGSHEYIIGLVPTYIRALPRDPNLNACADTTAPFDCGYAYVVNATRDVYKIIAMNTVEGPDVTTIHPLKSCDVIALGSNDIRDAGWCGVRAAGGSILTSDVCHPTGAPLATPPNVRFRRSFAVWGGIARINSYDHNQSSSCFPVGAPTQWCINPLPPNPLVDMFEQFVNQAGNIVSVPSNASVANRARRGAVGGTTDIICK